MAEVAPALSAPAADGPRAAGPALRVTAAALAVLVLAYPVRAMAGALPFELHAAVPIVWLAALLAACLRPDWSPAILLAGVPLLPILPYRDPTVPYGIVHLAVASQALPWLVRVALGRAVLARPDPVGGALGLYVVVGAFSVAAYLGFGYRLVFPDLPAFLAEVDHLALIAAWRLPTGNLENLFIAFAAFLDAWIVFALIRGSLAGRPDRRRAATWALMTGALAVSLFALQQARARTWLLPKWTAYDYVTRVHGTLTDPNALAAFLALLLPIAAGAALGTRGRWRAAWIAAGAVFASALVLTAGRMGWGAAVAGLLLLGWRAGRSTALLPSASLRRRVRMALAAAGAVVLVLLVAASIAGTRRDVRQYEQRTYLDTVLYTLNLRQPAGEILKGRPLMWRTAVSMVEVEPVFGIGLGRIHREFYSFSQRFDPNPPPGSSAHNTFLNVAAETGLLGLAVWVAALALLLGSAWSPPPGAGARDAGLQLGFACGLAAYMMTMLTGDRTILRSDLVLFWGAAAIATAGTAPRLRLAPIVRAAAAAVLLFLVISAPMRYRALSSDVQLHRIRWGFGAPNRMDDGTVWRWTSGRGVFHVPAGEGTLAFGVRSTAPMPQHVRIEFDGFPADGFTLADHEWRRLTYMLPPRSRGYHRVDVIVEPVWTPPGETEAVGVMVSMPTWTRPGKAPYGIP